MTEGRASVRIELFGVPRLRAGVGGVSVSAATIGEALGELGRACPILASSILAGGRLHRAYRLNLNGERFVSDPETPLAEGDRLILLAADAGG